jgi:hypothetical protein
MITARLFPKEEEFGGDVWLVEFPCQPHVGDRLLLYVEGHGEVRFHIVDQEFSNTDCVVEEGERCEFPPVNSVNPELELWLGVEKVETQRSLTQLEDKVLKALRDCVKQTRRGRFYKHVPALVIARLVKEPTEAVWQELVKLSDAGRVEWQRGNGTFVYLDPESEEESPPEAPEGVP